ncbi:hypothetical protein CYY_003311 [Polysphondylium violaceum]|uniref:Thioredoxin domain-containing protein n=1 Tax=Polysphondylium violaceum TaxID=133409 RepID=A0A8J4PZQ4_9MYCE|nr:hypothetical protein CYY_003311 [Polysphondylium violaceum]
MKKRIDSIEKDDYDQVDHQNKQANDDDKEIKQNIFPVKKKNSTFLKVARYIAIVLIIFLLSSDYIFKFVIANENINSNNEQQQQPIIKESTTTHIKHHSSINNTYVLEVYSPNYLEISHDAVLPLIKNHSIPLPSSTQSNNNIDEKNKQQQQIEKDKKVNENDNNKNDLSSDIDFIEEESLSSITTAPPTNSSYLILLYNKDCPFSQRLLPIYETLSRTFPSLIFYQLNGFNIIIKTHFHTRTTPTLSMYRETGLLKYKGPKLLPDIERWISNFTGIKPLENIELNPDMMNTDNIKSKKGFLLYFSCAYVVFLIILSIRRWINKIRVNKIKED